MSDKPNHICKNCGKNYFACNDCERVNSWKTACCTIECYDKYFETVKASRPVVPFVTDKVTTKEEFDSKTTDKLDEEA